jgi:23S rRNA (cytidine2498-2'-O)-methyltransferase
MTSLPGRIYQGIQGIPSIPGIPGFFHELERELDELGRRYTPLYSDEKHLLLLDSDDRSREAAPGVFWVQNTWLNPLKFEFDSISEAALALKNIQRNWAAVPVTQYRRSALIQEKLPALSNKPKNFPWKPPEAPVGSWTLLDAHTLIASPCCTSPFPGGAIKFAENKTEPPSRAYLKLWEALSLAGLWPQKGERCIDAGASPGGWTWALSELGAQVLAIDRSPLEDRIQSRPGIAYLKHDAFTLRPEDLGAYDWVFSDVICYPPRLYAWIETWLASGLCKNFVCTIKMQGRSDNETARCFARIPGSKVVHLCHNKHELTWIKGPGLL